MTNDPPWHGGQVVEMRAKVGLGWLGGDVWLGLLCCEIGLVREHGSDLKLISDFIFCNLV